MKRIWRLAYWLMAISALFAFLRYGPKPDLPLLDFSLFWEATQNLLIGSNPYDLPPYSSIDSYYASTTSFREASLPSLSPPPALGILAFLGQVNLNMAKSIYLWLFTFAFFFSSWVGFEFFVNQHNSGACLDLFLVLLALPLVTFFQALAWGSITIFAVIGICGFFSANAHRLHYMAGCFLALCAFKPHLFLLVFLYILWWTIFQRNYAIILGAVSVALIGSIVSLILQPQIFEMYFHTIRQGIAYRVTNASIGSLLYYFTGQQQKLLMYVPVCLGIVVLLLLLRLRIAADINLFCSCILPMSLLLAPYCWGHDYILCFATMFSSINYLRKGLYRGRLAQVSLLTAAITGCILAMIFTSFTKKTAFFVTFGVALTILSAMVLFYGEKELADRQVEMI